MQPTPGTNFVVALIVLVAIGTITMLVYKFAVWTAERRALRVNSYPSVMSIADDDDDDDQPVRTPVRPAPAPDRAAPVEACESPRTARTPEDLSALVSVLRLASDEGATVRKMVYYRDREIKLGNTPGKAATIKAATGLSKSGDPKSSYAKWSAVYDALFGEPEPAVKYPERAAQQRPALFPKEAIETP